MNIFIPTIGTRLILNEPWTFTLHDEYRNWDFWTKYVGEVVNKQTERWMSWSSRGNKPVPVTLPTGTVLSVDRIYIRKGSKDFDSVTFRIIKSPTQKPARFWVKLADVNKGLNVSVVG
jgi:hypothetical protein